MKQTGTESLTIEGDDNIVPMIKSEVLGGTLRIGLENVGNIHLRVPLIFTVTASDLSALNLSGAGSIEAEDIRVGDLETRTSGAGNMNLGNLAARSLKVVLSGAGDFAVSGNATTQEVTLSGAGSYRAGDLQSRSASVRASGAGSATVRVSDNLNASLSGVGSVMTPHWQKPGSFYGLAPMHIHPYATKVCTIGDYLRCFYSTQALNHVSSHYSWGFYIVL